MRITTNAILRNYNKNLSTSMKNLDTMRNRVMTQRKYMSTAEDPSSALRATSLERKYAKNNDYLDTVEDIQSHQNAQEDSAMQISNIALVLAKQYGIEGMNGTNHSKETRQTYADAWRGAQQSMLLSLNATYGDEYVFGGSDAKNVPFTLEEVNGKQVLKYRGEDVTNGDPKVLEALSKDSHFIDLGFGLDVTNVTPPNNSGQYSIDPATAFNTSLPGINLVGYGQDADKDPKNMVLLAGMVADELEKEPFDYDRYKELVGKFEDGRNDLLSEVTILGTQTEFLTTTKERLENNKIQIAEDYDNVVNVDMAEAIMDFSWAQYVYNASLKVGNNILTPSFIDFMN
jgi:flagellar hook-associated protein 3 FlgL